MKDKRVLISGAGIAGPTLAYWLLHYGFEPTIVEQAPAFRSGGYIIDFWGLGYEVAERMNLLSSLRELAYFVREVRFVDRNGRKSGGFSADVFRSNLEDRFFTIARGDLARVIYDEVAARAELLFGDSITSIQESKNGVEVEFQKNSSRQFDLVVGGDGLHSKVRDIAFGQNHYERYLGYYAAAFSTENYQNRNEDVYMCYSLPGKQVARFSLRENRTLFFLIFASERPLTNCRTASDCAAHLSEVFSNAGWECNELLDAMNTCSDFYFDRVSQICMPHWSRGRITLVGDAAFCPSLLAGQGAALAMAASYILAGELSLANGEHNTAYQRYEERLRQFILRKQDGAAKFGGWFAPKTALGIFVRDQATRLFSIPFVASKFVNDSIADTIRLPTY